MGVSVKRIIEISNTRFDGNSPDAILEVQNFCETLEQLLKNAPAEIERKSHGKLKPAERAALRAGFMGYRISVRKIP
jgi:hypothetical protein